jgi:uncharacterized protein (TIGR02444 family)
MNDATMGHFPDHPFWDFSIAVYGRDGVARACLLLQDAHGVDVNLLLYCCWIGASGGGRLGVDGMAQAAEAVAVWHGEVVRYLRALRKRLKGGFDGAPDDLTERVRQRIAAVEIDAEHVEQLMLAAVAPAGADAGVDIEAGAQDAAANIASYGAAKRLAWRAEDAAHLAALLTGGFPDLAPERARELAAAIVSAGV